MNCDLYKDSNEFRDMERVFGTNMAIQLSNLNNGYPLQFTPKGEKSICFNNLLGYTKDTASALEYKAISVYEDFLKDHPDWINKAIKNQERNPNVYTIQGEPKAMTLLNYTDEVFKSNKPNAQQVLDNLSERTGIEYKQLSYEDASNLYNVKDPNVKAFVYGNTVYLVAGRWDLNAAIHEYAHFFVEGMKRDNPSLYNRIEKQVKAKYQNVIDKVESNYRDKGYTDRDVIDEAMTTVIADEAERTLPIRSSSLMDYIKEFWSWVQSLLGIAKYDKLNDVARRMMRGNYMTYKTEFEKPMFSVSTAFHNFGSLINAWIFSPIRESSSMRLANTINHIMRNVKIENKDGVGYHDGKVLPEDAYYKEKDKDGKDVLKWNRIYVERWARQADNKYKDAPMFESTLKRSVDYYVRYMNITDLSKRIATYERSIKGETDDMRKKDLQDRIDGLKKLLDNQQKEVDEYEARARREGFDVKIDEKGNNEHFRAAKRISEYMNRFGYIGKDYKILNNIELAEWGIASDYKNPTDFIYVQTNDGRLHVIDIANGLNLNSSGKIGETFRDKQPLLSYSNADELNVRSYQMALTIAMLKKKGKLNLLGNTDILNINLSEIKDMSIDDIVRPVHIESLLPIVRNVLHNFSVAYETDQFNEFIDDSTLWNAESYDVDNEFEFINDTLKDAVRSDGDRATLKGLMDNNRIEEAEMFIISKINKYKGSSNPAAKKEVEYYEYVLDKLRKGQVMPAMEETVGDVNGWLSLLTGISNFTHKHIKWFVDILQKALDKAKAKMREFAGEHNAHIRKVMKDKVALFDKFNPFNDSSKYFDNLWSTDEDYEGYIYVDPNSMGSWAKSTANRQGWAKLNEDEKAYSKFIVSNIKDLVIRQKMSVGYKKEAAENFYNNAYGEEGMMPMIRKSENQAFNDFVHSAKSMDFKGAWDNFKNAASQWWNREFDFTQYNKEETKDTAPNLLVMNRQTRSDMWSVMKQNGIGYERNLYSLMQKVASNVFMQEEMNPAAEGYSYIKHAVEQNPSEYGEEQKNTLNILDLLYKKYVKQRHDKNESMGNDPYAQYKTLRKILSGFMNNQNVNKALDKVRSFHSTVTLMLRPMNDMYNFVQQAVKLNSRAISGSLNKMFGGNPEFTVGDLLAVLPEVFKIMGSTEHREKIRLLMQEMNMYNADMFDLEKPKFTNPTDTRFYAFRSKFFMGLNYLGDYTNREMLMIAMMMRNKSWNAYSVEYKDDRWVLKYDEKKDERSEIEKEAAKKNGAQYGYDYRQKRKMKEIGNVFFGSYDQESTRLIEMTGLGRLIMQFKRYMPDFIEEAWRKGYSKQSEGKYVKITKNGQDMYVWQEGYVEGYFRTAMWAIFNIKKANAIYKKMANKEELTEVERVVIENINKFAADMVMMSTIMIMALMVGDDDDDTLINTNKWVDRRLTSLYKDFLLPANIYELNRILTNPILAFNTVSNMSNVVSQGMESAYKGEITEGLENNINKYLIGYNSVYSTLKPFDDMLLDVDELFDLNDNNR